MLRGRRSKITNLTMFSSTDTPVNITYNTPSATNGLDAADIPIKETLVPVSRSPASDVVKTVMEEPDCVRCSLLRIEVSRRPINS
jgi:hypothetical protein